AGAVAVPQIVRDAAWLFMEMMDGDERVVPPVVADRQDVGIAGLQDSIGAPAEFRACLAQADHALGPVQHGIGIAALRFDVHALIAPGPFADNGQYGLSRRRESGLRLFGPLHWCPDRVS